MDSAALALTRLCQEQEEHAPEPKPWAEPASNQVGRWLTEAPPPQDWLFDEVLPAGIVAELAGPGGAGKSFVTIQVALALALGRHFGPFKPIAPRRVLYLGAEDSEAELWRRFRAAAAGMGISPSEAWALQERLCAYSLAGQVSPIIALDPNGNPAHTPAYESLLATLAAHPDTALLILDPKSRLCGLPENDNPAQTAFIAVLERLPLLFPGLSVLFVHHSPKGSSQGAMTADNISRGGSALVSGARWVAGLRTMTEDDANAYGVENARQYVELDLVKSNYTPGWPGPCYFQRDEGGALVPVDLRGHRLKHLADCLCAALEADSGSYSMRDLTRGAGGLLHRVKKDAPWATKQIVVRTAESALQEGLLELVPDGGGRTPKMVLRVVRYDG